MFTAAESSEENHTQTRPRISNLSLRPASNFIDGITGDRSDVPVSCNSVLIGFVLFCSVFVPVVSSNVSTLAFCQKLTVVFILETSQSAQRTCCHTHPRNHLTTETRHKNKDNHRIKILILKYWYK